MPLWGFPDIDALKRKGDSEGLVRILSQRDYAARELAIFALAEITNTRPLDALRVIELLAGVLVHPDRGVRQYANRALDKMEIDRLVEAVRGDLDSVEPSRRKKAQRALPALADALQNEAARPKLRKMLEAAGPPAAAALIQACRHDDAQKTALSLLAELGAAAVPVLAEALTDRQREVRGNAARLLVKLGDARAVPALIAALKDHDGWISCEAAEALGCIGDRRAVTPLIQALGSRDHRPRQYAAQALGKLADAAAVPALIQALHDPDKEVRRNAAEALGRIDDPRALEMLVEALKDTDAQVRVKAAEALGAIAASTRDGPIIPAVGAGLAPAQSAGDAQAISERTLAALVEVLCHDTDGYVRWAAASALAKLGEMAVPAMLDLLHSTNTSVLACAVFVLGETCDIRSLGILAEPLQDGDSQVRQRAFEALVKLSATLARVGEAALPAMIALLHSDNPTLRAAAVSALGQIGDPRTLEMLVEALQDGDIQVRRRAAEALEKMRPAQAVEPLIAALRDADIREYAIRALAAIGAPAVAALITTLNRASEDQEVRQAAAETLGQIGDASATLCEPLAEFMRTPQGACQKTANALVLLAPASVDPLRFILYSDEPAAVEWAAWALGKLKDSRAVPDLIHVFSRPGEKAWINAAQALVEIGSPAVQPLIRALETSLLPPPALTVPEDLPPGVYVTHIVEPPLQPGARPYMILALRRIGGEHADQMLGILRNLEHKTHSLYEDLRKANPNLLQLPDEPPQVYLPPRRPSKRLPGLEDDEEE